MKNHHHNGPIQHKSTDEIHEAIAARAYALWVADGKPEGRADEIWLTAERELVTGKREPKPELAPLPVSF